MGAVRGGDIFEGVTVVGARSVLVKTVDVPEAVMVLVPDPAVDVPSAKVVNNDVVVDLDASVDPAVAQSLHGRSLGRSAIL